jgi:hypothetical protein
MTSEALLQMLQKEFTEFSNRPWPEPIPEWFLKDFPKVIMELNQGHPDCRYRAEHLQKIISKNHTSELAFDEVGFIANVFLNVEAKYVHPDIQVFVARRAAVEAIRDKWNTMQAAEQKRLKTKEQNIHKLTRV